MKLWEPLKFKGEINNSSTIHTLEDLLEVLEITSELSFQGQSGQGDRNVQQSD